jgi:hypothetical protein
MHGKRLTRSADRRLILAEDREDARDTPKIRSMLGCQADSNVDTVSLE